MLIAPRSRPLRRPWGRIRPAPFAGRNPTPCAAAAEAKNRTFSRFGVRAGSWAGSRRRRLPPRQSTLARTTDAGLCARQVVTATNVLSWSSLMSRMARSSHLSLDLEVSLLLGAASLRAAMRRACRRAGCRSGGHNVVEDQGHRTSSPRLRLPAHLPQRPRVPRPPRRAVASASHGCTSIRRRERAQRDRRSRSPAAVGPVWIHVIGRDPEALDQPSNRAMVAAGRTQPELARRLSQTPGAQYGVAHFLLGIGCATCSN